MDILTHEVKHRGHPFYKINYTRRTQIPDNIYHFLIKNLFREKPKSSIFCDKAFVLTSKIDSF